MVSHRSSQPFFLIIINYIMLMTPAIIGVSQRQYPGDGFLCVHIIPIDVYVLLLPISLPCVRCLSLTPCYSALSHLVTTNTTLRPSLYTSQVQGQGDEDSHIILTRQHHHSLPELTSDYQLETPRTKSLLHNLLPTNQLLMTY